MVSGQIKIGVQLASLDRPLKKALEFAARVGADGVELDVRHDLQPGELSDSAIRQIRKLLDDYNLKLCALSFPTRRGYGVASDLDARVEATKRAMRLAYQLRAPVVVNQIGRVPDNDDPAWDLMVQSLTDIGRFGERVGSLLAAQTGSEEGQRLRELFDALGSNSIVVDLHPGNLIVNGFSPREAVRHLGDRIVHVHAADGVRDLARGRGLETPLGRGAADFPELMGVLEEHGYRGYFTVERRQAGEHVEQEITDAVAYLREAIR